MRLILAGLVVVLEKNYRVSTICHFFLRLPLRGLTPRIPAVLLCINIDYLVCRYCTTAGGLICFIRKDWGRWGVLG